MHDEGSRPAAVGQVEPSVRPLVERLHADAQGIDLGAEGMGWGPDPGLLREAATEIERLQAELLVAARNERERCAKLCETVDLSALVEHPNWMIYTGKLCAGLAALIRAA